MATATIALLLLSAILLLAGRGAHASAPAAPRVRGMNPDLAQHYVPAADGTFTCIDGSNKVPFSRVNDNYCDCFDGSDEPGAWMRTAWARSPHDL